jgi:geranylgeranyl pyrophosphate synthase
MGAISRQSVSTVACSDPQLEAALTYALSNPGKQLRSKLCRETAAMIAGRALHSAERAGEAVEFLHTYSLIHDDLPSMDDDDLRRGQPTLHKQFDEATAILVGDGLQALAFEWIVDTPELGADQQVRLIKLLSHSVGFDGMVGGQAMDIAAEGGSVDVTHLEQVHARKTGALIVAAVMAGAICAGATTAQETALTIFAKRVGLAFQVMDDVLDVTATSEELGKTAGKDIDAEKSTYVGSMGVDAARAYADRLLQEALDALSSFGAAAGELKQIGQAMVHRSS